MLHKRRQFALVLTLMVVISGTSVFAVSYLDNFNDGDAAEWTPTAGTWSTINNAYQDDVVGGSGVGASFRRDWTMPSAWSYDVDIQWIGPRHPSLYYGVMGIIVNDNPDYLYGGSYVIVTADRGYQGETSNPQMRLRIQTGGVTYTTANVAAPGTVFHLNVTRPRGTQDIVATLTGGSTPLTMTLTNVAALATANKPGLWNGMSTVQFDNITITPPDILIDSMVYASAQDAAVWVPGQAAGSAQPATTDGVSCLNLPCNYTQSTQRALWDKAVSLDLSACNTIAFRAKVAGTSVVDQFDIYFQSGSAGGWYYYSSAVLLLTDQWQTLYLPFNSFAALGAVVGWNDIRTIRISPWQRKNVSTNVYISDLRAKSIEEKNLLANSSFEICTTELLADYWGTGEWGLAAESWITDTDAWRLRWRTDTAVHHEGTRSLRIDGAPDPTDLQAVSDIFYTAAGQPYTFSAWLKSDQPAGLSVTMELSNIISRSFSVGTSWQRYLISNFTPSASSDQTVCRIYPTTNGTLWIDDVQLEYGASATPYQASPRDATILGQAVHRAVSPVADCPITAGSGTVSVGIDANRRFLVDGQPFIPIVAGWERIPTLPIIQEIARSGFNTLWFTAYPSNSTATLRTVLDNARSCGLKAMIWIHSSVSTTQMTSWINGLKDHPAIIAWYVYDEPSTTSSWQDANAKYSAAKTNDPSRPAYVNLLWNVLSGDYLSDILSTDYYPIPFWNPATVSTQADQLENYAAAANKPSWMWLQIAGNNYYIYREPTAPEVECMTYLALIHGIKGIKYFAHKPHGEELWDGIRQLNREIRELTPVLYSLTTPPTVSANNSALHTAGKTYNNCKYVFSVNDLPSFVSGTLTISGVTNTTAAVLYENRTVSVASGKITDTFAGYQRHVYLILTKVTGTVSLGDYPPGPSGITVTVELRQGGDNYTTTLDPAGNFTIYAPPGIYDVRVKAPHWLAQSKTGVSISGNTTTITPAFSLINGDADGDNAITSQDLAIVLSDLDTPGTTLSDLDGNGTVSSTDLSIMLGTMDQTGSP